MSGQSTHTRPPPAPLQALPLHILEYIVDYVPRRDVFSLSLAARFCCEATAARRFSRLRLTIGGAWKLRRDVRRWAAVLGCGDRFPHVRQVVVTGFMAHGSNPHVTERTDLSATDNDSDSASASDVNTDIDGDFDSGGGLDGGSDDDSNSYSDSDSDSDNRSESDNDSNSDSDTESIRFPWFSPSTLPLTRQDKRAQDRAWLPFAQFLSKLPGLKELVYACSHQLPRCVLAALHQHHPRCRLHVRTFSLRSLYQKRSRLHDIDTDELALARSPCLYSIHARCEDSDANGRISFNLEALERMVSGYAPGLKRVHILRSRSWNSPPPQPLQEGTQPPSGPWKGFPRLESDQPPLARLETLVLSGAGFGTEHLCAWNKYTDFGCLQRLELDCTTSPEGLMTLASMAAANKFRSLRTLGLRIASTNNRDNNPSAFDTPTSLLLDAMPHLTGLKLTGYFSILTHETILRRHGPSLRRLHLVPDRHTSLPIITFDHPHPPPPYCGTDLARQIVHACPGLEVLHLRIQRRHGGPDEVAAYRALGRLPRLRRLTLLLDCSIAPILVLSGRNFAEDQESEAVAEEEWIRKMLLNCAVDGALARAIFGEVLGVAAAPLERLRVEPELPDILFVGYDDLAKWVGRSWVCEARPGLGGPVVREVWGRVKWYSGREFREALDGVEQKCKDVWNELWPGRGGDWRDEWTSLPLTGQGSRSWPAVLCGV